MNDKRAIPRGRSSRFIGKGCTLISSDPTSKSRLTSASKILNMKMKNEEWRIE